MVCGQTTNQTMNSMSLVSSHKTRTRFVRFIPKAAEPWGHPVPAPQLFQALNSWAGWTGSPCASAASNLLVALVGRKTHKPPQTTFKVHRGLWLGWSLQSSVHDPWTAPNSWAGSAPSLFMIKFVNVCYSIVLGGQQAHLFSSNFRQLTGQTGCLIYRESSWLDNCSQKHTELPSPTYLPASQGIMAWNLLCEITGWLFP